MKRLDYSFAKEEFMLCDLDEEVHAGFHTIVKRIHVNVARQFIVFMECQDPDEFTVEYMCDLYEYWLDAYLL